MGEEDFLSRVYKLEKNTEIFDLYTEWAETYDQDMIENGYNTPARCAGDLTNVVRDFTLPILDVGCGTGYSGLALMKHGFTNIDGTDINPDMLAIAQTRKVYKKLYLGTLEDPLPGNADSYAIIAAIGVIGSGAAPVDFLEEIVRTLSPGAYFVFSLNEHTLKIPIFNAAIEESLEKGYCELLSKSIGSHLEKLNTSSTVFVLQKK